MTIDEAIKIAEEEAKEQDKLCKRYDDASGYTRSHNEDIRTTDAKRCEKCAEEHRQLAEWLKELKQLRKQRLCDELNFVQPHKKIPVNLEVCKMREATQEEREGVERYIDSIAEPCKMTAEEYRQRMIQAFHNADCDELIAVCVLPTEKEFEHLEWLLKNHYKQETCEDAISRQAALDTFGLSEKTRKYGGDHSGYDTIMLYEVQDALEALPPVTPQPKYEYIAKAFQFGMALGFGEKHGEMDRIIDEIKKVITPQQKTGHWEHGKEISKEYRGRILVNITYADWHCSNCNYVIGKVKPKWNYCPNCGAKMQEVEDNG